MIDYDAASVNEPQRRERGFAARIASAAAWSIGGLAVYRGLMMLSLLLAARIVGRAAFGRLGIVQASLLMLQNFAGLGLGAAATRYVAELRTSDPRRAGQILASAQLIAVVAGALLGTALALSAPWFAREVLAEPALVPALRWGAASLAFSALHAVQTGALAGFELFRAIALLNAINGLLAFPLVLVGAWLNGVEGAVLGTVIASAGSCACNAWVLARVSAERNVHVRLAGARKELSVLWHYGIPTLLSTIVHSASAWGAQAVLANSAGGYEELGIFKAANQWRTAVSYLPLAIGTGLLPVLSSLLGTGEWHQVRRLVRANAYVMASVVFVSSVPLALLSAFIMRAYGPDFAGGDHVMVLVLVAAVIAAPGVTLGRVVTGLGVMWAGTLFHTISSAVLVITTLALSSHGASGLAAACIVQAATYVALSTVGIRILLRRRELSAATR